MPEVNHGRNPVAAAARLNSFAAAEGKGLEMSYEDAREIVYGEAYETWKAKHQTEAPAEKQATFEQAYEATHGHKHGH